MAGSRTRRPNECSKSPAFIRAFLSASLASWALSGVAACAPDEATLMLVSAVTDDDAGEDDDAGRATSDDSCDGRREGESCGVGRHCIGERCVWNRCGDAIAAEDEECDDGNQDIDDGCSPSCRRTVPLCGDGRVEGNEACDDGNRSDEDECTNLCTLGTFDEQDAGTSSGETTREEPACPRLLTIAATPYEGPSTGLHGLLFALTASFEPEPDFSEWYGPRGKIAPDGSPHGADFLCTEIGVHEVSLLVASSNCVPVSYSLVITCSQRP
jgi:cysteine-rich repeat protein